MLLKQVIATALVATFCMGLQAQPIAPGSTVPPLVIEDRGEVTLNGDDIVYQHWSSKTNPGKLHVLQYLAATRAASKVYSQFTDSLPEKFDKADFHITTVLNLDDAMWGTSSFVVSEIESNKREFPEATLVLDENGDGLKTWKLKKKGAAIAIMDRDSKVLYFTQDPISDTDLEEMLAIVKSQIGG